MKQETRAIAEINFGKRHRIDYGDVDALAASIQSIGLLHPVVIRPDGRLVTGGRRIRAFQKLGRERIPVRVMDLESVVRGEHDENTCRKDFTYAEAVEVMCELRPMEQAAAKERQLHALKRGSSAPRSGKLPEREKGEAADRAARATGKKRRTLEKAETVIQAAEQEPERFGDLAEQLKEDGVRVEAVYRAMQQRQERASYEARAEQGGDVADLIALAEAGRKFKVIYADPPWSFEVYSVKGKQRSPDRYYDTASLDDIKSLPIGALADDDCALFIWGVMPELPGALDVIRAWGFDYKTVGFVWLKATPKAEVVKLDGDGLHWGMGYWTRANAEFCLLATKGSPLRLAQDVHQVVIAPAGEHSAKPEDVRTRIEQLLVGPYLELFARRPVPGWSVWGNEVSVLEAAE
jgi:N6-adenosine-specific RNA methylase IME4